MAIPAERPRLITLSKEPKRPHKLGIPDCNCPKKGTGLHPELPPTVRQIRGSLSLLLCSACGGLRAK
jgi:hypothetical protein